MILWLDVTTGRGRSSEVRQYSKVPRSVIFFGCVGWLLLVTALASWE